MQPHAPADAGLRADPDHLVAARDHAARARQGRGRRGVRRGDPRDLDDRATCRPSCGCARCSAATPKPVKFSRVNIYARDGYRCQYCGAEVHDRRAHVRPRHAAFAGRPDDVGEHRVRCYVCNASKANRTPAEAGMKLLSMPARPTWMPAVQIRVSTKSVPDAWRDYVYWTARSTTRRAARTELAAVRE